MRSLRGASSRSLTSLVSRRSTHPPTAQSCALSEGPRLACRGAGRLAPGPAGAAPESHPRGRRLLRARCSGATRTPITHTQSHTHTHTHAHTHARTHTHPHTHTYMHTHTHTHTHAHTCTNERRPAREGASPLEGAAPGREPHPRRVRALAVCSAGSFVRSFLHSFVRSFVRLS